MKLPTTPNSYLNEKEKDRLLMQYAGIFRHQIKEFGEVVSKRMNKPRTNYSK